MRSVSTMRTYSFASLLLVLLASAAWADTPYPDLKHASEVEVLIVLLPSEEAKAIGLSEEELEAMIGEAYKHFPKSVHVLTGTEKPKTKNVVTVVLMVEVEAPMTGTDLRPYSVMVKVFEDAQVAREGKTVRMMSMEYWRIGIAKGKDKSGITDAAAALMVDFTKRLLSDNSP